MSYESNEGIRRSDLWLINKSPLHFRYAMDHEREETPALLFGRAAHSMILTPECFGLDYEIAPDVDRRTKAGKAEYQDFLDYCEECGKEPISAKDAEIIKKMHTAICQSEQAYKLLTTGEHEKEFYWTDDMTRERCKCKVDCITEYNGLPYVVDYKTTDSCEDGHFERTARKYGYQFQAGMYCEGVFQNTLEEHRFAFVAQEKTEPYAVRVYLCDPEWVHRGYDKFRELIGIYHRCKETGNWYGYEQADLVEV